VTRLVNGHIHDVREGGEVVKPTMPRAEGMHKHDRMMTAVPPCLIDRRCGPVEELVTEIVHARWTETERSAETFQTCALSGRVVPLSHRFCERFLNLTFDRDNSKFIAQTRHYHQVCLAIPSGCL
jgi:hypothetical protein